MSCSVLVHPSARFVKVIVPVPAGRPPIDMYGLVGAKLKLGMPLNEIVAPSAAEGFAMLR